MPKGSPFKRLVEVRDFYIENKGYTTKSFERVCNLGNGYFYSRLKSLNKLGYVGVNSFTLEKVKEAFPEINLEWLQNGNGEMFLPQEVRSPKDGRPYYSVDFLGGFDLLFNDQTTVPTSFISMPPFNRDGFYWCNMTGDSMYPLIASGSIICLEKIESVDNIIFGKIYAIVTNHNLRTVKWVVRSDDDTKVRLIPENKDAKYGDYQDIPKNDIIHIFRVAFAGRIL